MLCASGTSYFGPPALPVYAQPVCPGPGYFWVPGYWAWNDDYGYYWVPGTWVVAPGGMLWTPGYWGWNEGFYVWHPGYWGPHIGFYGGINYGFGYTGVGFFGGEWRGRDFYYNRSVTNINVVNVTNVYNKTVIVNNTTVNRVSYNGGPGGIPTRPLPQELAAEHERHEAALPVQAEHEHMASQNRQLFASENHGRPAIAATARPAVFSGHDVVAARVAGAAYHAPAMSPREARGSAMNLNRAGHAANARPNDGFQKFGQPNNNARPGNVNNGNAGNWNNVARPGNQPAGNQQANGNNGYQEFGGNTANNRGPANKDQGWRPNPPNGNPPHPGNQAQNASYERQTAKRVDAQSRPSGQSHQNAPHASSPHQAPPEQHERPAREPERGPERGPSKER